ncbi:hypothetical protein SDC9_176241 [bioreactor metagenome]|uniref:Uncharacterized protein n=1 Tax=bioreactor metagenome TaxID=1076179 RepID=A0A645GRF4_9ZZZZ
MVGLRGIHVLIVTRRFGRKIVPGYGQHNANSTKNDEHRAPAQSQHKRNSHSRTKDGANKHTS